MDSTKKRKSDQIAAAAGDSLSPPTPTAAVLRVVLDELPKPKLIDLLASASATNAATLAAVRSAVGADAARRKLFVRGLGPETSSEKVNRVFSAYGEVEEAVAVVDKATGKPRGFGFVVFRHVDGALMALREPSKKIDGRMTVAQLASAGNASGADVADRKVYVGNIPSDVTADRLLAHFMAYGEVEEGPLGFDNQIGKPKRFAFFIYKTGEGARASLVDPIKTIDGQQIICKLAVDGKKGKVNGPYEGDFSNGLNVPPPVSGFMAHQKPFLNSSIPPRGGGPGFQPPPLFDGGFGPGGYGPGGYGPGSQYNESGSQYRGPGSAGGYSEGGNYGPGYPSQMNQPGPRGPPLGGMYPGVPPYY